MKRILLILFVLLIAVLQFFYGSAISLFLTVLISSCIIYFLAQVSITKLITAKLNQEANPSNELLRSAQLVKKKYNTWLPVVLMIGVFLASLFCLKSVVHPGRKHPYFTNNQYHAIANTAIAYNKNVTFTVPGTEEDEKFTANISREGDKNLVRLNQFYLPIYKKQGDNYTVANNIYPKALGSKLTIRNAATQLEISILDKGKNWKSLFKKNAKTKQAYSIKISSTDSNFRNEINGRDGQLTFERSSLSEGMTLYNLILNNEKDAQAGADTYTLLERVLHELGDTYLLANQSEGGNYYTIFPSQDFVTNGYELYIDGQKQERKNSQVFELADNQNFYIDFHERGNAMSIVPAEKLSAGVTNKKVALLFENPNYYPLNNPTEDVVGNKAFRFLTNNQNEIIETAYNEGYLFKNHGFEFQDKMSGLINFTCGKPNTPLAYELNDHSKPTTDIAVVDNNFVLSAAANDVVFELKDFSKNGFNYATLLIYAGLIFLLIIIVLIFFPGKKLSRIEPIVFAVIYALFILRLILSWRIATFPPLENISKFELENTLIGFDYQFMGINLPIPFSITILIGLLAALVFYRLRGEQINKLKLPEFFTKFSLTKQHLYATALCVLIFLLNKMSIKVEVIFRITSIIIPLILYLYYSFQLNKSFQLPDAPTHQFKFKALNYLRNFIYYFVHNPTFQISLITFASFAVTDKGFAVLFALFILLKNILLHFFKNSYSGSEKNTWAMFFQPKQYWIYGIVAFVVYLVVIGFKSAFYFALLYKLQLLFVISALLAFAYYLLQPNNKRKALLLSIPSAILLLVLIISPLRQTANQLLDKPVRHVKARASIIHQPIGDLVEQNEYSSYQAQKVIASAESQWFINTFITKEYDADKNINLQPHTKVGVNYSTQTRDVVLARYIIGEWGNFTMYLILLLFVLPMVIYLLSYKINLSKGHFISHSYGALIPFLLLLTLALFVWLTATNRFVFFGQDFPFLSITSRISVLLPLLLFFTILIFQPEEIRSKELDVKGGVLRYFLLLIPISVVAVFTTLRNNDLETKNFNVVATQTETFIQKDFNGLLQYVQDSLSAKKKRYNYDDLVQAVTTSNLYKDLKNDSAKNIYTKSLLAQWEKKPSMARKINSPLYVISDNGRFSAEYNKNLYLHLPKTDNKNVWNGSITESTFNNNKEVVFQLNNETRKINLPAHIPNPGITAVLCPASWFVNKKSAIGLADVQNQYGGKAELLIYKYKNRNVKQQASSFVSTFEEKDEVIAQSGKKNFHLSFKNSGNVFADNKWVNSKYRIIYPLHEQNFWVYHFSNAVRSVYSVDTLFYKDVAVNLDYNLEKTVYQSIQATYKNPVFKKNNRFKFSVIAADGDGHIRLMQDIVSNRKTIDPNDSRSIYNLQQNHFFFSNTRNERDQWGNANLMTMSLGPGSSIKPLVLAAAASRVNAGWENLMYYPEGGDKKTYAGFKLEKDWKNDDHYYGSEMNAVTYLESSSNFYHSLIIFLSSYTKNDFKKETNYSLSNILTTNTNKNSFPRIGFNGQAYRLPTYNGKKSNWPKTSNNDFSKSYFGNENSLLCNGLEWNANLRVRDKDKNDLSPTSYSHINFGDSLLHSLLEKNSSSAYLWSYPEISYFLQSLRAYNEIHQNFNLGFKTTTLGGYPYQLSPFKMLEMYNSLCLQNRSYGLKMLPIDNTKRPWDIDSSWGTGTQSFYKFLSSQVFQGMKNVVSGSYGTARILQGIGGGKYFVYAKTGTINEQGARTKNSRRLIVILADKDISQAENIGKAKTYSFYFTVENARDFDWGLLKGIIQSAMQSTSFNNYFKTDNE